MLGLCRGICRDTRQKQKHRTPMRSRGLPAGDASAKLANTTPFARLSLLSQGASFCQVASTLPWASARTPWVSAGKHLSGSLS